MNYIANDDWLTNYIKITYIKDKPEKDIKMHLFTLQSYQKFWAKKILKDMRLYKDCTLYLEDLIDDLSVMIDKCENKDKLYFYIVGDAISNDILDHLTGNYSDTIVKYFNDYRTD